MASNASSRCRRLACGAQATLDPVREDAPLNATDAYGASMIAAETILRAYRHDHGLPVIALRPSSVYGPGRRISCFIRDMIDHTARRSARSLLKALVVASSCASMTSSPRYWAP
ncbi:MAG: NAD-dependent epimerase/dehydratase family protein [Roseiarcus sp.]